MYNAQQDLDSAVALFILGVIFFMVAGILSFILTHLGED
jgi:hypothetical protein